jgi:acyl transferase domain-containing protein
MELNGSATSNGSRTNGYTNGYSDSPPILNSNINGHANQVNGTSNLSDGIRQSKDVPVAICGMGLRLPQRIRSDAALYDFLVNKKDARTLVVDDRYNSDAYYRSDLRPGSIISKYGYFLNDVDLSKFDLSMFNMTPSEVEQLDPNQRLLLEVTREALEGAGEVGWRGKKIGTYVGLFSEDWQDLHSIDTQDFAQYQLTGQNDFIWANRIAYEYDLKGPRYGGNPNPQQNEL